MPDREVQACRREATLPDYQYYTDLEKVRANALSQAKELEELFARDLQELQLPGEETALIGAERRDGRRLAGSPRKDG